MHLLRQRLLDAAAGRFPPADGAVELTGPAGGESAVVAFANHFVVAAAVDAAWLAAWMPPGDVLAPLAPRTLAALAERVGRRCDVVDAVLAAPPLPAGPGRAEPTDRPRAGATGRGAGLREVEPGGHPRVVRALAHRSDVRAFAFDGGVLVLGRGLAGRLEVAVEVEPAARGRGLARAALADARARTPPGEPLFAQVSPGNVASLRAGLAAGFVPLAAEAQFVALDAPG